MAYRVLGPAAATGQSTTLVCPIYLEVLFPASRICFACARFNAACENFTASSGLLFVRIMSSVFSIALSIFSFIGF